jgi:signal transduction histidine kinase
MVAYVAIIVIPTLGLLALGLQSVRRQRQAIDVLTTTNERLALERVAEVLERRLNEGGALALRDADPAALGALVTRPPGADRQRVLRAALARTADRHPLVAQWVLLERGRMQFPFTGVPLAESVDDLAGATRNRSAAGFVAAFTAAERLESSAAGAHLAAAAYRRAGTLATAPRLRAIAVARAARSYRSARNFASALDAWREVDARHGDEYDLFHQPYGLVAAIELCELEGQPVCARAVTAARDLASGRWEVSAQQATGLIGRLERVATPANTAAAIHDSVYLRELRTAEAIERALAGAPALRPGEVRPMTIRVDDAAQPVLCGAIAATAADRSPLTACAVVETGWASDVLLPEIAGELGTAVTATLVRAGGRAPAPATTIVVPMRSALEGWILVAPRSDASTAAVRADGAFFAGATLAVIGVLLLGVVLLVRDVSRQTAMARLRSNFVSGVSHQLRTPLTLIRLYGELLTDYPDAPDADRRERLDVITSESQRLTTLIERVLDFSRIERGQKPYVLARGDLGAAVRPVVEVYAGYLRQRGFTVDVSLPDGLPAVRVDADAVSDAIVNLMDNASKYASDGRYVGVWIVARGTDVVLEIADRGAGIPAADRARLFQPFQRGSAGREKGGYGLGLFLVRHTMEGHGGRVEVDGRTGQGTVFRLVFPAEGCAEAWRRS